jgi:uncharacterized protein (TIGR00299 family) protein
MARILYLDCFAGISGDMLIGALLDAGLPLDELRAALGSLRLDGVEVSSERVLRAGVSATKFHVHEGTPAGAAGGPAQHHHHGHSHAESDHPPHAHAHAHGHHTLTEIAARIDRSALADAGRAQARRLFKRLAEAEAEIHQTPLDRVHLHEVGAVDSIVDIISAVFGLTWFAPDRIVCSPLNVGSGTVQCAHGTFPVPAPATARLLHGVPVYSSPPAGEMVTPTGAVVVTTYATEFGGIPPMTVEGVGYGAGTRDPAGFPNVLRVMIGKGLDEAAVSTVDVVEFEIDDMNPQILGAVMEALYAAGALEVFYTPVQMKKNRPGTLVSVIAPRDRREAVAALVFRETTTIGIRYRSVERECLEREAVAVATPVGTIRMKLARRQGAIVNAAPEFEDCARAARESGRPLKDVQALAMKAWLEGREGSR